MVGPVSNAAPVTTSFNGGELSPLMGGRVDTSIYAIAAAEMENFAPTIEGPMQKCPGFRRIRSAAPSAAWLMRFVFNQTQGYVLECLDRAVRFYTNGARIEVGGGAPYEVAVPYAADEWARVSTQQSFDRLYMARAGHPPAALSRTGAETFSYAPLALKNGPFKDGNSDEAKTVTITGSPEVGGVVTINASAPIFLPGHAGAAFQIEANDFSDVPAWEVGIDDNTPGTKRRSDGKVYVAASSGRTGTVAPIHDEGTEWDGAGTGTDINDKGPYGVQWTYLYDRFGVVRIDTVTGPASATGEVIRRLPDSLDTVASWRWAHAAFSDAEGWPGHVFTWAGRLCFLKDFALYASVVGDYLNHQAFTSAGYLADDLAFRLTLSASDVPLWARVDRDLIVGTASAEYAIGAINAAAGISGTNIGAKRQSGYGSAPVWPIAPGTSLIYAQRGGRTLREAEYDFSRDRYVSSNITRWARHVAGDRGIVQLGQQQQTEELIFAVRGDGQLVLRSYDPEQEVKGFARRVLAQGGVIVSAVSIPSEDGSRDDIWALCGWRVAPGVWTRSVQRMADWWQVGSPGVSTPALETAFFVDDGLSDTLEVASATIGGLNHLIGVEVAILADGVPQPRQVVGPDATITLAAPARVRTVGRPYAARFEALRPELRTDSGQSATAKVKRLARMVVRVLETASLVVNGGGGVLRLVDRVADLFSGDSSEGSVLGSYDRAGSYVIASDDPLPAFVLNVSPRFEVSDR